MLYNTFNAQPVTFIFHLFRIKELYNFGFKVLKFYFCTRFVRDKALKFMTYWKEGVSPYGSEELIKKIIQKTFGG